MFNKTRSFSRLQAICTIAQDKNIAVKGTVFTHNAHNNAAKK